MNQQNVGAQHPAAAAVATKRAFNQFVTRPETQGYLEKVLGTEKNAFVSNLVGLYNSSPMLQQCEPASILYSAIKATALKLPLDANLGFAYVIPYGTKAQFQIGWRGFVQLALRTNLYRTINVRDVRLGEIVGEDFASGELKFAPLPADTRSDAPIVGYLAFFELTNGFRKMSYWTVAELQQHGMKYSKTFNRRDSVWQTNFDSMARKTVLKLLLGRFGPMSVELQTALKSDQASFDAKGTEVYVDNDDCAPAPSDEEVKEDTDNDAAKVMAAAEASEDKGKTSN